MMMMAASPGTPGTPGTPSTPGTPGGPTASGGEPSNGGGVTTSGTPRSNQPMAGLPEDPKTREQILRERYLKGLKKRKCTVCGNTARARCPFRACKTCCSRAKNPCTVHVLKADKKAPEGTFVHPSFNVPPSSLPDQPWLPHNMQLPMASGYLRPGYSVPSPYNIPTPIRMGIYPQMTLEATAAAAAVVTKKYVAPGARSWVSSNVIDQQQELQRIKNLRIAAQKEAIIANIWRLQKMKDYAAGEIWAEDEAFDRYMLNGSLLEEVFALNAEGLRAIDADGQSLVEDGEERSDAEKVSNGVDKSLVEAMRTRLAADPKRKEARRKRFKQTLERSFRKLKNIDQELEFTVEEEDTLQVGVSAISERRWEPKRFKARTEEGQQVLQTIEAFEALMQQLNHIKSPEDIQACMDSYKKSLGGNLSYLIPNLYPREDVDDCNSNGSSDKRIDGSLISPRATLLSYLSGAFLEANPDGQVIINNRNKDLPNLAKPSLKLKERPWESGVEKLERLYWHRKYLRGMGWWKVYAHDETIQRMCFERANANTTIMEL
ncbi:unnamed protein product [Calypogeia fissa]